MNLVRRYTLLAYTLMKGYMKYMLPRMQGIKPILEQTYIEIPFEEYVAATMLTEILVTPFGFVVGLLLGVGVGYRWLGTILFGFLTATIVGVLVFGIAVILPRYMLNSLKGDIEKHLPYAATHMATIAGTGVPPQTIFQMMGGFKDYGKVAFICERIGRNITVFGYDIITAITEEAKKTPSYKLRDLLWSISSTIRTGGDLRTMLLEKSKGLMDEQRRIEAKYIEFLSMMAEVYATVFVAGTIIVFVMTSIMGIMGGLPIPVKMSLQVFTYLLIPLASISFIIIIDSTKPAGVV